MIIYQVKCKVKHCPMPEPPKKVTPGMKIFLTDTTEDGMFTFCQLSEWNGNAEKEFKTYLERHQICGKVVSREEIPVTSAESAEAITFGSAMRYLLGWFFLGAETQSGG